MDETIIIAGFNYYNYLASSPGICEFSLPLIKKLNRPGNEAIIKSYY